MLLLRLVLLIAIAHLGSGPGGDRSAAAAHPREAGPAAVDRAPPSFLNSASPQHADFTRLSPWRHRIKSVLQDKVAWCPQPVDRGPAKLPDLIEPRSGSTSSAVRPGSLIALRC